MSGKSYKLLTPDGIVASDVKGTLGGQRKTKIYGRLDCSFALRYVEQGTYQKNRVFFLDEATAIASGFRPCAKCMPDKYRLWKANS